MPIKRRVRSLTLFPPQFASNDNSESVKSKLVIADVNMEELVGNTDGFADSG